MIDKLKNKYVLGAVVGGLVLVLGYYIWSSQGSSPLLSSSDEGTSAVSQELLMTLGKLRTIKLDTNIFSDPAFVSLTDFGVTIPPEAAGRRNPFAPVGVGALPQSTTTPR